MRVNHYGQVPLYRTYTTRKTCDAVYLGTISDVLEKHVAQPGRSWLIPGEGSPTLSVSNMVPRSKDISIRFRAGRYYGLFRSGPVTNLIPEFPIPVPHPVPSSSFAGPCTTRNPTLCLRFRLAIKHEEKGCQAVRLSSDRGYYVELYRIVQCGYWQGNVPNMDIHTLYVERQYHK